MPYDEIAGTVGKSAAALRQIAHRGREHVTARRPRRSVSRAEQQSVVERFQAALTNGDLQGLLDVLAPDVVLMAEGGGVVPAAIRPLSGAKTVARQLSRFPLSHRTRVSRPAGSTARPRPDRPRRRVRHRGEPDRRRHSDHPHLRDPQPAQADRARQGGRPHPVAAPTGMRRGWRGSPRRAARRPARSWQSCCATLSVGRASRH